MDERQRAMDTSKEPKCGEGLTCMQSCCKAASDIREDLLLYWGAFGVETHTVRYTILHDLPSDQGVCVVRVRPSRVSFKKFDRRH